MPDRLSIGAVYKRIWTTANAVSIMNLLRGPCIFQLGATSFADLPSYLLRLTELIVTEFIFAYLLRLFEYSHFFIPTSSSPLLWESIILWKKGVQHRTVG